MHKTEDEDSSSTLRPRAGICRRLFRFVVAKLGVLGEKEINEENITERHKLFSKGSMSDITIHFKQVEDSEDNGKCKKKNTPGSSSQESERETVITLANGSNGPKKRSQDKEKRRPKQPEAGKPPQAHGHLRPLVDDINKKSDAFIEKMRKRLA